MKTVLMWILKFLFGFFLLLIHWSLFLVYVGFLFWRSRVQYRRATEQAIAAEAEVQSAQRIVFECELVHVTRNNVDGESRQSILYKCYRGDALTIKLFESADAPTDAPTAEVWTKFGQVGELAPIYAKQCAEYVAQGHQLEARIKKMLNRTEGVAAMNCLIEVMIDQLSTEEQTD